MTGQTAKMVKVMPADFNIQLWTSQSLKQLALLMHAHRCQKMPNGSICTVRYCKDTKTHLNHLATCEQGSVCRSMRCRRSKELISHWYFCTRDDCPLCQPIRRKA